jgi:hypothetical protein
MESVITTYIARGFVVVNKTETSTTLQKKEFELVWAVICFVLCLLPLLIYPVITQLSPKWKLCKFRLPVPA